MTFEPETPISAKPVFVNVSSGLILISAAVLGLHRRGLHHVAAIVFVVATLIAILAGVQAFRDAPHEAGDRPVLVQFCGLLVALGFLMKMPVPTVP